MLVVVSGAPVPCYADRVWPNPLHVVCGPTRQRWRDGFNFWASSTLQCSSGFIFFKFVKPQSIWRINNILERPNLQAGSCATWPEDSGRKNLPTWNNLSFWKVSLQNHHLGWCLTDQNSFGKMYSESRLAVAPEILDTFFESLICPLSLWIKYHPSVDRIWTCRYLFIHFKKNIVYSCSIYRLSDCYTHTCYMVGV